MLWIDTICLKFVHHNNNNNINNPTPWPFWKMQIIRKWFNLHGICSVYITSNSCDIRHFLDIPFFCFIDFITHMRHKANISYHSTFISVFCFCFLVCNLNWLNIQWGGEKIKIFCRHSVRISSFKNTINITFDCLSLRSMVWHCVLIVKMRAHC